MYFEMQNMVICNNHESDVEMNGSVKAYFWCPRKYEKKKERIYILYSWLPIGTYRKNMAI